MSPTFRHVQKESLTIMSSRVIQYTNCLTHPLRKLTQRDFTTGVKFGGVKSDMAVLVIITTIISKSQILKKPSALYKEHDGSGGAS